MSTPVREAMVLGALQGVSESLPLSSSGHLALAHWLFGLAEVSPWLGLALHLATLAAPVVVVRHKLMPMVLTVPGLLRHPSRLALGEAEADLRFVAVASLPSVVIALVARGLVGRAQVEPWGVGVGLLVTGLALLSTAWAPDGLQERPSLRAAVLVGLAQGLAGVPGISRSGATIAAALWLRVRPDRAFELSMLTAVPVALVLLALDVHDLGAGRLPWGAWVGAASAAFLVALAGLEWLQRALLRGHFSWFAWWVLPLACATLSLAAAWPPL